MKTVLAVFKAGQYPNIKRDLADRQLKKGCVSYHWSTGNRYGFGRSECSIADEVKKFLGPIHEALKGNEDYEAGNIVLLARPMNWPGKGYITEIEFEILVNRVRSWADLPDNLIVKHGRRPLTVTNITSN